MNRQTVAERIQQLERDPDDGQHLQALEVALSGIDGASPESAAVIELLDASRLRLSSMGQSRQAAQLLSHVLERLPEDDAARTAALWRELGRLRHEELLDDAGARTAWERALELQPSDAELREQLEQLEQAANNWPEIVQRFQEEAEESSDPTLKTLLYSRAAALVWQYRKKQRLRDTDRLFRLALGADPARGRALRPYVETLLSRERFADAARVLCDAAAATRSRDNRLHYFLRAARLYVRRLEDAEAAARCFEAVREDAPTHDEALGFLAQHLSAQERWQELAALYEKALESRHHFDGEDAILVQVAMLHWRTLGDAAKAEPYFARLRKVSPAHPSVVAFYLEHCAGDAQRQARLAVLTEALRITKDPEQKLQLALQVARDASEDGEQLERGIDAWKMVQRLEPQQPEALGALRRLYHKAQKWNALVELMRVELESKPAEDVAGRVAVLRAMVPIYRDNLHLDVMVIRTYNAILELLPQDSEALDALCG
ncbi:MAG: hypothetical protein ACPGUV_07270, partial [Polyangiales bacterium]